ncbi:major facilitator superfamily domain-containing protein [Mycena rosella]|uniref:Major facilitator superfamily domain-containing protein n=1 Tax=Mycena rosella TaxID=1033263 RepID=A0AAD7CX73_MYCRO|nr:major facilitator superfamily domain-containing protein [Mycena rosella]
MSTTTPPLEGDAPASDLPSRAVSPLHDALDIDRDIEHMPIADDPRAWSPFRKNVVLTLIASASMIAGLAANIQNPAIADMEADLPASASQISLYMPLFWSAISEVKGRKLVYVVSIAIFTAGSVVVALSKTIELVIVFRCIQATGSSAVMAIGAATLAYIFDSIECGTKLGFYYMAPLLGPSLAPIMGGVLTQGFSWRAPFWFLVVVSGLSCLSILVFLKDTFRQERSMTYQSVLKSRLKARSASATTSCTASVAEKEPVGVVENLKATDLEKQDAVPDVAAALPVIKLTMRDVNPFKPLRQVLRRTNNLVILLAPVRLMFAFNFVVVYSASRTLESAYGYNALKVGLVLLSFGLGNLGGSIFSGRWSDKTLAWLKAANGRVSDPEMRLKSTALGLCLLPPSVLVFGWVSEKRMHSPRCAWAYTSTLAYIVDANNGPSSTVAVPLQDSVGDGWQYTIWAGLLVLVGLLVLLVVRKGGAWREASEACEKKAEERV